MKRATFTRWLISLINLISHQNNKSNGHQIINSTKQHNKKSKIVQINKSTHLQINESSKQQTNKSTNQKSLVGIDCACRNSLLSWANSKIFYSQMSERFAIVPATILICQLCGQPLSLSDPFVSSKHFLGNYRRNRLAPTQSPPSLSHCKKEGANHYSGTLQQTALDNHRPVVEPGNYAHFAC